MSKMFRSMATGAVIGIAISTMILPQLDRKTQRNLKRAGKRAMDMAEDACDIVIGYMR